MAYVYCLAVSQTERPPSWINIRNNSRIALAKNYSELLHLQAILSPVRDFQLAYYDESGNQLKGDPGSFANRVVQVDRDDGAHWYSTIATCLKGLRRLYPQASHQQIGQDPAVKLYLAVMDLTVGLTEATYQEAYLWLGGCYDSSI